MKKIFNLLMIAAAGLFITTSCGSPKKMAESAEEVSVSCNPQILEVIAGNIKADVTVTFPEDFFHPKAIVEMVPVLVYNGGEAALDPVMLQGEDFPSSAALSTRHSTSSMWKAWRIPASSSE